jgi:AraC-like DNA-binding protein/quercetin dioxygenase-like cupin family protein
MAMHAAEMRMDETGLAMRLLETRFAPKVRSSVPLHAHEQWEWHYVSGGACGFEVDGRVLRVRPGDCFLIPPRVVHGVRIARDGDWLLQYVVLLAPENAEDKALLARMVHRAGRGGLLGAGSAAIPTVERVCRDHGASDPWRRRSAASRLSALFCDLAADSVPAAGEHPALSAALSLIQRRLHGRITIAELAAAAQVDASYLNRIFRRALGQPPLKHFLHLRLSMAADLLRGAHGVAETAEAIGFGDPFHFSRRFKAWAGTPPSALSPSRPRPSSR